MCTMDPEVESFWQRNFLNSYNAMKCEEAYSNIWPYNSDISPNYENAANPSAPTKQQPTLS